MTLPTICSAPAPRGKQLTNCLDALFKRQTDSVSEECATDLQLYNRLLEKTTLSHSKSIKKHIQLIYTIL